MEKLLTTKDKEILEEGGIITKREIDVQLTSQNQQYKPGDC